MPLAPHVPYTWRILRTYGLDRFVSDIRPIGVYGKDVDQRKDEIFGITEKLIRGLVDETRAEIILPLGGALIPYVVDPDDLAKATGVQVLNTKAIGIRFAEMCVAFGMTQSASPIPRAKLTLRRFRQAGVITRSDMAKKQTLQGPGRSRNSPTGRWRSAPRTFRDATLHQAKLLLLDTIGCGYAALDEEAVAAR